MTVRVTWLRSFLDVRLLVFFQVPLIGQSARVQARGIFFLFCLFRIFLMVLQNNQILEL